MSEPSKLTQNEAIALEQMLDSYGVIHVLEALAIVAREKAEHLRVNWQDEAAAKAWDRAARAVDRFATHACIKEIK